MHIVLTGSSGRLGRAIFNALAVHHSVVGIDRSPFSTTHLVGDFTDGALLRKALKGDDAIIHCAAFMPLTSERFPTLNFAVSMSRERAYWPKGSGCRRGQADIHQHHGPLRPCGRSRPLHMDR